MRLLRAAGLDASRWEVRVFEGDQANAFALPGQKTGVYDGLYRHAENDAQPAAVIGHAIVHNLEAHAAERVSTRVASAAGAGLLGAVLGASGVPGGQQIAAALGTGAQYGLVLPYSRNQELEADRIGLMLMARADYDPRAAIELWSNMRRSGAQPPAFLSTHPGVDDRIAALRRLMPEALEAQASIERCPRSGDGGRNRKAFCCRVRLWARRLTESGSFSHGGDEDRISLQHRLRPEQVQDQGRPAYPQSYFQQCGWTPGGGREFGKGQIPPDLNLLFAA